MLFPNWHERLYRCLAMLVLLILYYTYTGSVSIIDKARVAHYKMPECYQVRACPVFSGGFIAQYDNEVIP